MRNSRLALGQVTEPPQRASNLNKVHQPELYGSICKVVACRSISVYVRLRLPKSTGVEPGEQSGIHAAMMIGEPANVKPGPRSGNAENSGRAMTSDIVISNAAVF